MDAVQQALAAAGGDAELRLQCHTRAARLHRDRYASSGDTADLDHAVDAWQEAADLPAQDDPRRPGILAEYGAALVLRGEHQDTAEDVDAAVRLLRLAVDWTPEDDPELAARRRTLGIAHSLRFHARGVLADLYEADWMLGEAARGAADDPALAQDCWLQRGAVVMELAARIGSAALLDQADSHLRNAVQYAEETGQSALTARARQLRGLLLERRGAPGRALPHYRRALDDTDEPELAHELRAAVARLLAGADHA
jgi:tetratricopeptide (TPR) repeat protein